MINSGGGGGESAWRREANVKEGRGGERGEREKKWDGVWYTKLNLAHTAHTFEK